MRSSHHRRSAPPAAQRSRRGAPLWLACALCVGGCSPGEASDDPQQAVDPRPAAPPAPQDSADGCPDDPDKTAPGGCGCGVPDTDRDGDGSLDCVDRCPDDPNKLAPGDCGCGVDDADAGADCGDGEAPQQPPQDPAPPQDDCPDDPDKLTPGECGCGTPEGTCGPDDGGPIRVVGTTESYDSDGRDLRIDRPSDSAPGDLLVLILHRTDDDLPLEVEGWTRLAECYKRGNGFDCSTADDCVRRDGAFCDDFGEGGGGHDLAQAVFFRVVGPSEPSRYTFDLTGRHPGWAILTALRGADTEAPLRDSANEGCDRNPDSLFPSVRGEAGDLVLLSQSFDDRTDQSNFNPPDGTELLGYVSQSDEAGFLFGGLLDESGETGAMKTHGPGAASCKDALVSLTIKPR